MSTTPPPIKNFAPPRQQTSPLLLPPQTLLPQFTPHPSYHNKHREAFLIQKIWKNYRFTSLKKHAHASSLSFNDLKLGQKTQSLKELEGIESKLKQMHAHTKEEKTIERELSELLTNKKLREEVDEFTHQLASKHTLKITQTLLQAIHSLASHLDPSCAKLPKHSQPTRSFLTAFMLTNYPKMLIETSSPEGDALQQVAAKLTHTFQTLCAHLAHPPSQQKGAQTLTAFRHFYTAWQTYIPLFETFKSKDCETLCEALIAQYIKIHIQREKIRYTTKVRQREMFELEGKQLTQLRDRIKQLKGKEGIFKLEEKILQSKAYQEISVLTHLSEERFLHEIATNPHFKLESSHEIPALEMTLQQIDQGIKTDPKNYTPLIKLLKNIAARIAEITPHRTDISALIHTKIQELTEPLTSGKELNPQELLHTILFLLDHLKSLSNDSLREEIDGWIKETSTKLGEGAPLLELLPEALRMITHTTQKISIELINFQTQTFRDAFILKAAEKERALFNQNLEEYECSLDKTWVVMKHAVKQAQTLGLSPKRFYTKHGANYLAIATTLNLLTLSPKNFQEMCPETFLFDKETLNQQRANYQTLRFSLFTLTLAERVLTTTLTEHEKQSLLYTIQDNSRSSSNKCAKEITQTIATLATSHTLSLSKEQQKELETLLKKASHNENNFLKLVDISLGKALFAHLTTGHFPPLFLHNSPLIPLLPQIDALSTRLNPVLSFNASIHKQLYHEILSDFAHEALIQTLTQEAPLTSDNCSLIYLNSLETLQHLQQELKKCIGVATGLSLIKSKVVTSDSWDVIYPIDETRFESLVKHSGLLKVRLPQKELEHQIVTLFQKECARLHTPLKAATLPTLVKQMNQTWTHWLITHTAQDTVKKLLKEASPPTSPSIKPYASFIKSFLCQELKSDSEKFDTDPYKVQLAIYLSYTWQAFCKTTVKQNTHLQLNDGEIDTLVQRYDFNGLMLAQKKNGATLLEGLLRTTQDILKVRDQHFIDVETFALKLKRCFSVSHPGAQGYLDICKTLVKKSLKTTPPLRSEQHLPRNARKMMLKFLTPTLFHILTNLRKLFIETHGTLFEKEDTELIKIPPLMRAGRKL